jgi:hypothetical protein
MVAICKCRSKQREVAKVGGQGCIGFEEGAPLGEGLRVRVVKVRVRGKGGKGKVEGGKGNGKG